MSTPLPGHTDEEILRIARKANQAVFFRTLAVISVVGLGIVGFLAVRASEDANDAANIAAKVAHQDRKNAIAACERSKQAPDGFRYIQAHGLLTQAQSTHDLGVPKLAAKFGVPVKVLKVNLKQQRAQAHALLSTDCVAANPLP